MQTAIYCRVSTEEQATEGFSIHAQKDKLTKYALSNDWDIVDYYVDDGISGKNLTERPQVSRLIEDVKKGKIKNVLIYKLDRLTRSVKDLIYLIELFDKNNCTFNSQTEKIDTSNAVGRMFVKIIGIFAEFERENIPQLWKNKEWAREFANFIIELVGNNIPPKIIEIHPPFNDYCKNFSLFFDIYEEFEKIISAELPNTNIFIENRCGTFYKGGKFIISNGKSIIQFLQELEVRKLRLKLVLDYPQVFSAESIKMDDIKLKKIIEFNNNIKPYISHIGGFHLWGKRKSQTGRWTSHTGDLNTFFSNNNLLKDEFISSVVNTFDDNDIRFFVPEVNSSEEDLQSIIFDLLKYDVKFNFND